MSWGGEVATVLKLRKSIACRDPAQLERDGWSDLGRDVALRRGCDERAVYDMSRMYYTPPERVEAVSDRGISVGAEVRLLPLPPDDPFYLPGDAYEEAIMLGFNSKFFVRAVCSTCARCVELEHCFEWPHDLFGSLELSGNEGCPMNHYDKCSHMGHSEACHHRCLTCGKWFRDECPVDVCRLGVLMHLIHGLKIMNMTTRGVTPQR